MSKDEWNKLAWESSQVILFYDIEQASFFDLVLAIMCTNYDSKTVLIIGRKNIYVSYTEYFMKNLYDIIMTDLVGDFRMTKSWAKICEYPMQSIQL